MKVKVLKPVRDKNTNQLYKVGQILDLSKERADYGVKFGTLEIIETEKKESKPKKSKKEKK